MSQSAHKRLKHRPKSDQRNPDQERVVEFFLNLYKIQLHAPQDARQVFRLREQRQGSEYTYDLRIHRYGKWASRPMGILPLGEKAGKKSNCFKVFYDDVLVVKIPQTPIRDFEKYIEVIGNERKITHTLHPDIKCIVPAVSSILKKIPSFFEGMCWVPEEVESKCIERLKQFPKFQDYLKIEDNFVFFMDISQYSFLAQVLEKIFNSNQKIKHEIVKHPDFLLKFQKFEERYGIEHASVWLQMNKIFQKYQIEINSLLKTHGLDTKSYDYKPRQWFLGYLAEQKVIADDCFISEDFFFDLNQTVAKLRSSHGIVFRDYKKTVEAYIKKEAFKQAHQQICEIVSAILKLLAFLRKKKVSVRDLKPDNIFLTLNSTDNSTAFAPKQKVHLGLIDLETSVSIDATKLKKLGQPLPGGTPSYATPSNFVQNIVLERLFKDVPRILHLQDWHACICMIYVTITGEVLFTCCKNLLYNFVNTVQNMQGDTTAVLSLFKKQNRLFWQSAQIEFNAKINKKKDLLSTIEVAVGNGASTMFYDEAIELKNALDLKIQYVLNSQKIFTSPKSIGNLMDAPPEMLCHLREKYKKANREGKCSSRVYKDIVILMKKLEALKTLSAKMEQWIGHFKSQPLTIRADILLEFMFRVVSEAMALKTLEEHPEP